jgi:hypothetical protein
MCGLLFKQYTLLEKMLGKVIFKLHGTELDPQEPT